MLIVEPKRDRYRPIIRCDRCGERIVGANLGNAHWKDDGAVIFSHKKCYITADRQVLDRQYPRTEELDTFLSNLLINVVAYSPSRAGVQGPESEAKLLEQVQKTVRTACWLSK